METLALAIGHDDELAAFYQQARALLDAIRAKADTMRATIDAVLERSNLLLREMNGVGTAKSAA
jgi:hypothetical protein